MNIQENHKNLVRRFNEAFIQNGNEEVFEATVHRGFINHSVSPGSPGADKASTLQFIKAMRKTFPDLKVEIRMMMAEGDLVTTFKTYTGTHRATHLGIEATGRKVQFDVIDILRFENGQAIEHWSIRDAFSLYQQLTRPEAI